MWVLSVTTIAVDHRAGVLDHALRKNSCLLSLFFQALCFSQQVPNFFVVITRAANDVDSGIEQERRIAIISVELVTQCLPTTLLPRIAGLSCTFKRVTILQRRMVRVHPNSTTARAWFFSVVLAHRTSQASQRSSFLGSFHQQLST